MVSKDEIKKEIAYRQEQIDCVLDEIKLVQQRNVEAMQRQWDSDCINQQPTVEDYVELLSQIRMHHAAIFVLKWVLDEDENEEA